MGIFGCSHPRWKNVGGKKDGIQQQRCTKCGKLRRKRVSQFWCSHRKKMDRRMKGRPLKCVKCGKVFRVKSKA